MRLLSTISLIFLYSILLSAQWVQNYGPIRSVGSLYNFNSTLYAVSSLNGTNVTTDDGVSWVTKNNSGLNLAKFYTSIGSRLIMYSFSGGINYSDNNGKTWTAAVNKLNAFNLTGFYQYADTLLIYGEWRIYKSTNKGVNWTQIYSKLPSSIAVINTVAYVDNKLYAGTQDYGIYMSSDYGANWVRQDSLINLLSGFYKQANSFVVVGNDLYCASLESGNTSVYKLSSGSILWQQVSGTSLNGVQVKTFMKDGDLFYIGATDGLYVSSNFGATWTKKSTGLPNTAILSLLKKDNLIIAGCAGDLVTDAGGVYTSADTGKTWKQINHTPELPTVTALTVLNGTIYMSGTGRTNVNDLMKSTDGGINWVKTTRPNLPSIMGVKNINGDLFAWGTNTSVTLGYGFMKSTDGGTSWSAAKAGLGSSQIVTCLYNVGTKLFAGIKYVSGSSVPMLYASTDAGATWAASSTGLLNGVTVGGVAFLNGTLFATSFYLYSSPDTGKTWIKVTTNLPTTTELGSLFKVGQYMFTYINAKLYKTVDGANWVDASSGMEQNSNATVGSIELQDSVYYAGTSNSGVYKSTNGGTTWAAINTGFWENYPVAPKILLYNNTIVAGGNYSVYRKPISDLTGVHESVQVKKVVDFELMQNYPNPFNPSTTITFALPQKNKVELSIYNQLGQKIIELFNGEAEAGQHSFTWNAGNFSSGVYFYELKTGKYNSVKKLILIK